MSYVRQHYNLATRGKLGQKCAPGTSRAKPSGSSGAKTSGSSGKGAGYGSGKYSQA